jgi:hypothetical protein
LCLLVSFLKLQFLFCFFVFFLVWGHKNFHGHEFIFGEQD